MRLHTALIATCAVAALAVAAAPAPAAYKIQTAKFRATLSGIQTSSWKMNQTSYCGTETGNGKQSFSYHQTHPVTLSFWRYVNHDGPPEVSVPGSIRGIPVTGSASRTGTIAGNNSNPLCAGTPITNGPDLPPPPKSDCGTKRYAGFFDVRWYRPQDYPAAPDEPVPLDTSLYLDEESPQIPFMHCPFFGPLIMQRLAHTLLPERKVFGTRPKIDLKTNVHRVDNNSRVAGGVIADTTVSWTLHLTRVR